MSKLNNKLRYLWIYSPVVISITAGIGALSIPFNGNKQSDSFVEEMKALLEKEEQMEGEFMENILYPPQATQEDIENIDRITSFERANGFCHIHFLHAESNGSNYRVNDAFWINESKIQRNRDFLKEFITILEIPDLPSICKKAGYAEKVLVKNSGDNKRWIYVPKSKSDMIFEKWSNKQKT